MPQELRPEDIIKSLDRGKLAPFYLFYGPNKFLLERTLSKIKDNYIPDGVKDFNLQVCYGDEIAPSEIINMARTVPFMASNRLIIVRRIDEFNTDQLNQFIPYFENPVESTCLIFISVRADFKKKFYKSLRDLGFAVSFRELRSNQVVPWIMYTAKEMGMKIDREGCFYLQEVVGNRLQDLYSELTKLRLSFGPVGIGVNEVRESAIHSRMYSVFELMDALSVKNREEALSVLARFLEEEDKKSAPMQIIGMLNRQIGLLLRTKDIARTGGDSKDVASILGIPPFSARDCLKQSKNWSVSELEKGITTLFHADRLLKSGSRPKPVLENLIMTLCG